MKLSRIKRAIISVSNKDNLNLLLPILKKFNVEIISSGGTYKSIKEMNFACVEVSKYTNFPEILNGRVKTLHPKIHAGILNIRNNKNHKNNLKRLKISNIDLVIVNFYPFENIIKEKHNFQNLIENIDIGGSTLARAAAKNFNDVTVISDPKDYKQLINEINLNKGATSLNFRKAMSAKTFRYSAYYDSLISNWMSNNLKIDFPERKTIYGKLITDLRYGENPHQKGSLYSIDDNLNFKQLHGKKLSYNNYNDIYSALSLLKSLKKNQGTVIVKHANPCGVSEEKNQLKSFRESLECDPTSAFGGVIAFNSVISKKLALDLSKKFFEIILADGFTNESIKILKKKKNVRLIDSKKFIASPEKSYTFLGNLFLSQEIDSIKLDEKKFVFVTKKKPTKKQINLCQIMI